MVEKYQSGGRALWKIDEWLPSPRGPVRYRKRRIPTKELAETLLAKQRIAAFEGAHIGRPKRSSITVADLIQRVRPVVCEGRRSLATEFSKGGRLVRVAARLGTLRVEDLTADRIVAYRRERSAETSRQKRKPSLAHVNREVALLRRCVNVGVELGLVEHNPVKRWPIVAEDNVRRTVVDGEQFQSLLDAAGSEEFRTVLLLARSTGMRRGEIERLTWDKVDLARASIRLESGDTKSGKPRLIPLSPRLVDALRRLPRSLCSDRVFIDAKTGAPWHDVGTRFKRVRKRAKLERVRFHDLRRVFVTEARRAGVPESVVMKMTGHKTRAVFERYNVVSEDDVRGAAEIVARALGQDLDKVGKASAG